MSGIVTLLYWDYLGASELNAIKIVEFLGGTVRKVKAVTGEHQQHRDKCLITTARTFINLRKANGEKQIQLKDLAEKVFLYGLEPNSEDAELTQEVTGEALLGIEQSSDSNSKIRVSNDRICRQLSGLSFEAKGTGTQHTFVEGRARQACTPLLSIGNQPICARVKDEGCEAFLMAGDRISDLDSVMPRGTSVLDAFAGLTPLLIFLYDSLYPFLWHNDAPTACFIIDDPLLRRKYGHLDYRKLLELMERQRFSTSIAFIPWNYKRSQRSVVESFSGHLVSLCVHGCDHTAREFGADDLVLLRDKSRRALERMALHRELSGLDFDDVMVFPQGIFSTTAMKALKASGYLAAINSTLVPVDSHDNLILRNLLEVAMTQYSNMPLFARWYPTQSAELALSLFLGKPALLVEHHGFFRDGYGALAETIEWLHGLEPRLQWVNPATICSRACWKRSSENGYIDVLFFTDRFVLRNESGKPQQYALTRHGSTRSSRAATVNGKPVDIRRDSDGLHVQLLLAAGEEAHIKIESEEPSIARSQPTPGFKYKAAVFVRRRLSEFRDNYVDMNSFLSRAARNR